MTKRLHSLLAALGKGSVAQLQRENRFLKVENQILRSKLKSRVVVTPEDRARLIRFGKELGPSIKKLITIVKPRTFTRWLRAATHRDFGKRSGRPPKSRDVRELVVRLALENPNWGTCRITGELQKLRVACSATTVKRILERAGLGPQPNRRKNTDSTWNEFMRIHANSILAADFLTKEVWTLAGKMTAYILFFIHIGTRKVNLAGVTFSPHGKWMAQQARNVGIELSGLYAEELPRFLIHDNDRKFTPQFDAILCSSGMKRVKIPSYAPNCNAYAEAWVGSLKRECLNHFTCFGLGHLSHVLQEYLRFYNRHRAPPGSRRSPSGGPATA